MHKQQHDHFSFTLQQWYRTFGLEKDLKKIRPKHLFIRVVGIIWFSPLCVCCCKNSRKRGNLHYILVARTCFFSFWATFSIHVQKVFSLSGFSKERIVWPSRCRRLWHRNYMLNSCSLYVRLWKGSCVLVYFHLLLADIHSSLFLPIIVTYTYIGHDDSCAWNQVARRVPTIIRWLELQTITLHYHLVVAEMFEVSSTSCSGTLVLERSDIERRYDWTRYDEFGSSTRQHHPDYRCRQLGPNWDNFEHLSLYNLYLMFYITGLSLLYTPITGEYRI